MAVSAAGVSSSGVDAVVTYCASLGNTLCTDQCICGVCTLIWSGRIRLLTTVGTLETCTTSFLRAPLMTVVDTCIHNCQDSHREGSIFTFYPSLQPYELYECAVPRNSCQSNMRLIQWFRTCHQQIWWLPILLTACLKLKVYIKSNAHVLARNLSALNHGMLRPEVCAISQRKAERTDLSISAVSAS